MSSDVTIVSLRFGRARGKMPPLGALSLKASLAANDLTCEVVDTQFNSAINPFAVDALAAIVRANASPVLAFSVFHDAIPLIVAVLTQLAPELRGRRIFLGGPGVVGIERRLVERLPTVEAVVVGEGETIFPIAIKQPSVARRSTGVFWRTDTGRCEGTGRTARENLDELAAVDWKSCRGYSTIPWSTMRGCPFECEFCEIIAFMGRKVRMRNMHAAIDDLQRAIEAMAVNEVDTLDDTFTVSKRRVMAVCRALVDRRLNIRFSIFSRPDTLDGEMMAALAEAGCDRVFFGIDGGDDDVLRHVRKGLSIRDAEATITAAAGYFNVTASFIWGYPFESMESFVRMMGLMQRLRDRGGRFEIWPQIHLLSPSAGTPMFEKYGYTLTLDPGREVLPIGRSLNSDADHPGHDMVMRIIREDPLLSAAFWQYDSPGFADKCERVDRYNAEMDRVLGARIVRGLAELETVT